MKYDKFRSSRDEGQLEMPDTPAVKKEDALMILLKTH